MDDQSGQGEEQVAQKIATVSGAVLATFFNELAKVDQLGEIAANLRKLVLDDGILAEPAIRAVIFPDAP